MAQDVIITEDDCLTVAGIWISEQEAKTMGETFAERVAGRFLAADVSDPETGEVLLKRCLLYTSPSPRDRTRSRMPSSA